MKNNKLACCYWSYYSMRIFPLRTGWAIVSPCPYNILIRENRVILERNLKEAWNCRQFQFQRKLISKKDWSFCNGADCCYPASTLERDFIKNPRVKNAITKHKINLDYFAPKLIIAPSFICNNNCYFCFQASDRRRGINYQLTDNLIKEIKEDIIPNASRVWFSGGEPFFSPVTRELVEWAIRYYPQKRYTVITNGTLIHQFGLQKIIQNNIFLIISFYGMNKATYREVTKTDNFDAMFRNVTELLKLRYEHMRFSYLVLSKSIGDLGDFCQFVEKHEFIKGVVSNVFFEGEKYYGTMKYYETLFSHISDRLTFRYRYWTDAILQGIVRRVYNPLHTVKYMHWKFLQERSRSERGQ